MLRFDDPNAAWAAACGEPPGAACLKWRPLGDGPRLSVGGEARWRHERSRGLAFADTDADAVWLQRYSAFLDLEQPQRARVFLQLGAAFEAGRDGPTSPVDENRLWLQNGFIELGDRETSALRAGRQELRLGSARLVDVREGPNVRRSFDALRVLARDGDWNADLLAAWPRRSQPGVFDDRIDGDALLWGLYATGPAPGGQVDAYYLGHRDDAAGWSGGTIREQRHSIGSRWFGSSGATGWNVEAVLQFGSAEGRDIRAWTVAAILERALPGAGQPVASLSVNVASGDRDPDDGRLELFNPLYPRGNYFSEDATLGPRNFFNVNPSVMLRPAEPLGIAIGFNAFWRQSRRDGIYEPSGQLLRGPDRSRARHVGNFVSFAAERRLGQTTELTVSAAYGFPGRFIRETGEDAPIRFLEVSLRTLF